MNIEFRRAVIRRQHERVARYQRFATAGLTCPPAEVMGMQFPAYTMGEEEKAYFAAVAVETAEKTAMLEALWFPQS